MRAFRTRLAAVALPSLLLGAGLTAPAALHAQSSAQPSTQPALPTRPAARPADVASEDAIIKALYEVISGPAGQARDWDRMRSLFHPAARMEPVVRRREGEYAVVVLTPDDYVQRSGEMLTKFGFTEHEIARKSERFGNLVHVWSTYDGGFTSADAPTKEPNRGINSIQLVWDGTRWWVLNIAWQAETSEFKLPAQYLPAK